MEPIRVLHVVTKMDAAGIETLLMNFYRNIDRTKVQFDFLTHRSEKGFYDDEILSLGGKIFHVHPINPFKHKIYLNDLDKFFQEHKEYRIVHSHINTYSMYPLRAAMKAGVPVRIAHSHISNVPFDLKTPFRIYTKSKLKRYSTYNFACSKMAGKWLYGLESIKKNNFKVINNSINALLYRYDDRVRKKIRNDMNVNEKFIIGHIGRFSRQKNHKFLIDIFKNIHEKEPNSVLMLIGDGELRTAIESKIKKLGLDNSVILTGVRSDIPQLLQAIDVFIFPSLYEGLGIVTIEAQAAGLPCIVANTVPKEAFITNLMEKVSLKESIQVWTNEVLKYRGHKKRDTYKEVCDHGYDICETAKWLENFYLEKSLK